MKIPYFLYNFNFSKSLIIIHEEKTKEITTVNEAWICCGLNLSLV